MTAIKLNNYYHHLTECITLEVSEEIAVTLSIEGRRCDSYKRRKRHDRVGLCKRSEGMKMNKGFSLRLDKAEPLAHSNSSVSLNCSTDYRNPTGTSCIITPQKGMITLRKLLKLFQLALHLCVIRRTLDKLWTKMEGGVICIESTREQRRWPDR